MAKKAEKKTTEISTVLTQGQLDALKNRFPVDPGSTRINLPRLGMFSQDKTEEVRNKQGKKEIKVISEAGTFYIDRETDKEDKETGKKIWAKEELGTSIEAIIVYQRKQLSFYDEDAETYTSSPVYDSDTDSIPLFREGKEVDRGTPAQLKARKEYQTVKNGKKKSSLEDNRILYVLFNDEFFQMNLRGTSMYSFMTYARKSENVLAVVTGMDSKKMEKGDIEWNQMTFEAVRSINGSEADTVIAKVEEIEEGIEAQRAHYAQASEQDEEKQTALDKF